MKKTTLTVHSIEVLSQKLAVKPSSTKQAPVNQAQGFYVV
jgi:hypothetical protein